MLGFWSVHEYVVDLLTRGRGRRLTRHTSCCSGKMCVGDAGDVPVVAVVDSLVVGWITFM